MDLQLLYSTLSATLSLNSPRWRLLGGVIPLLSPRWRLSLIAARGGIMTPFTDPDRRSVRQIWTDTIHDSVDLDAATGALVTPVAAQQRSLLLLLLMLQRRAMRL